MADPPSDPFQRVANRPPDIVIAAPRLRKLALTAHVTSSVGWLGAVAAYLALAIAGMTSPDAQMVRAAYLAMDWMVRFAILPLSLASLLTGLISALGTPWGLFRHYWVLFKFGLNIFANIVLLLYTRSISNSAGLAAMPDWSDADLLVLRNPTHVLHSGGALLVLLTATVLAVYKPRGMTRYGYRKQQEQPTARPGNATSA